MRLAENEITAEPQDDHDDNGTQELRHRVSRTLTDGHRIDIFTKLVVDTHKTLQHLLFGNEGLDDTQTAQRLVELSQNVAPLTLHLGRLTLQLTADRTHNPACQGSYDNDKHGELPADGEHGGEADNDGDRLADKHVDTAGNTVLYTYGQ